jgi:hypothetical protein
VRHFAVVPRPAATVLSQVMVDAVGRSWLYYVVTLAITTTLGLAANTSFGGLPVLLSLLARDGYVPHVFALRGDRLVFQHGIWALAVLAGVLLAAVGGNTDALIPLYAIGVFIGFTLSQAGLVRHWARTRPAGWGVRAAINAVGATASGLAAAVFLLTKFAAGAWVVACAVPALIGLFRRVHRYYLRLEGVLARDRLPPPPARRRTLVIVPVREVSLLTATAISDALSFGDEVVAVTVEFVEEGSGASTADELRQRWEEWAPGVRLVTLRSQYHSVVRPLLRFILTVDRGRHERVMVLIPDVVPRSPWGQLLHDQLGLMLAAALRQRTDVLVCLLPYHPLAAPAPAPQPSAPSGAPEPATGPSAPG